MRRALLKTAAILAAVFLFLVLFLPPKPLRLSLDGADAGQRMVRGVYHVHTTRSDGAGDKAAVAAAAARAGQQFVIFTDHGDGTRAPDAPAYLDGVLCIDGVEISTNGGHYVALDLPAAPYPLGGEAAAVVEDVRRLGGFGLAAHPHHPRAELAWSDWRAPIDGLEWINADSEWRDESVFRLARVLLGYPMRPSGALSLVFDRPSGTLDRWDALSKERRVIALAAADAHGGARGSREAGESSAAIGPSYEASFGALSNRVVLDEPPTGDASRDARMLLDAIRAGRVYSVVDAVSPDVLLRMEGPSGTFVPAGPLPAGAQPAVIAEGGRARLEIHSADAPGSPAVPWVVTNWTGTPPTVPVAAVDPLPREVPLSLGEWRVEHAPTSSGRVSGAGPSVTLEYRLGADTASPFVAAAVDVRQAPIFTALAFRGSSAAPTRVSVQLRYQADDRRWVKSVYLDRVEREYLIPVGDMVPAERGWGDAPLTSGVRSILIVVDLVNARPGASGSFTISGLRTLSLSAPR